MRLQENGKPWAQLKVHTKSISTSAGTVRTYTHTKKEIEDNIIKHARRYFSLPWYRRGTSKELLEFWVNELEELSQSKINH